ncbi:MAG: hypothetical protein ABWX90_03290 [Candidatus Saccharimonadales bacterium]
MSNALMMQLGMEGAREEMRGHIMFRDVSIKEADIPEGHKAMLIAGVVLVPEHFLIEGETMVQVKGFNTGQELVIFNNPNTVKLPVKYHGWSIEDVLNEPIWKF